MHIMRRRSDITANTNNCNTDEGRDHSEWSTLPHGPLREGLELEVDPSPSSPSRANNTTRSNDEAQQHGAGTDAMEDIDLSVSSNLRGADIGNVTARYPHQERQQETIDIVELSPRSQTPINETTINAESGIDNNDDELKRGGVDLQSFRKRLFGHHGNMAVDDGSGTGDTNYKWGSQSTGLSPPSATGTNGATTEPPSWTRTATGHVEQDYFGSSSRSSSISNSTGGKSGGKSGAGRRRPRSPSSPKGGSPWANPLNLSLFASNLFAAIAESIPVTLVPTIGAALSSNDSSSFASRAAASAVLGTSFGKFINGPAGDIFGARRVVCLYSLLLGASLMILSICTSESGAIVTCALIEFFSSVQQPCVIIILAAHYRDDGEHTNDDGTDDPFGACDTDVNTSRLWNDVEQHGGSTLREPKAEGRYEAGIYVASLGSRVGSLLSIPCAAVILNSGWGWRTASLLAAFSSFASLAVVYLLVKDSPDKVHDPQNPIRSSTIMAAKSGSRLSLLIPRSSLIHRMHQWTAIAWSVFMTNIVPSLRSVLTSGTFWIVSLAHAGGSMVRSSERILGTYIRDTSGGTISEDKAGSFTIFLSLGIFFGLAVGGNLFTKMAQQPFMRKKMILWLYALSIAMCYTLSFLASPIVRALLWSPRVVTLLQIVATFAMGAGIAVQYYQIPAIVGATYFCNKGLYSAYTDGVAYGISSIIWRVVGGAVEEGEPQEGGWAYGWAAVALLVVLCAVVMVQFVEHYFCRGGWKSRMERTAPDTAFKKKDDEDRAFGPGKRESILKRRFGVGLSPIGSIGAPAGLQQMSSSPMRRLQMFPTVDVQQISPMNFFQNHLGSLRSKSALDEVEEEALLDEEIDNGGNNSEDEDCTLFDSMSGTVTFDDVSLFGGASAYGQSNGNTPMTLEEEHRDRVMAQLARKENQVCADCPNRYPRWASFIVAMGSEPLGCFCCHECVAFHRQLGTHIVFVRSCDHDKFRENDVIALEAGGNKRMNALLEAALYRDEMKPGMHTTRRIREQFIRLKYQERKWAASVGGKSKTSSLTEDDLLGLSQLHGEPPGSPDAIELVQSYDLSLMASDDGERAAESKGFDPYSPTSRLDLSSTTNKAHPSSLLSDPHTRTNIGQGNTSEDMITL